MEAVKTIALWILTVLFILGGVGQIFTLTPTGILGGLLYILAAVIIMPIEAIEDFLYDHHGVVKVVVVLAFLFSGAFMLPQSTEETPALTPNTQRNVAESGTEGRKDEDAKAQTEQEEATPTDDGEYFRDGVFQTKDFRIEITDWRVIQPGEPGNQYADGPIIAFWYDVTNRKTDDTIDPTTSWILYMSAVQDNNPDMINELNISAHPDSGLVDNQMSDIKPGGTLRNAVGYELSDTTTPVTLTASLFGMTEYGSMTFDIAG